MAKCRAPLQNARRLPPQKPLQRSNTTQRRRKPSDLEVPSQRHADCLKESELETSKERQYMLGWAVTFLIIALIAAALGFTGLAGTAVGLAKILFVVFLVLFVVSLIFGRRHA